VKSGEVPEGHITLAVQEQMVAGVQQGGEKKGGPQAGIRKDFFGRRKGGLPGLTEPKKKD